MKRKGGILLFVASCIPGCGQMYQGYMKRGVSMMGMCGLIIAVASILNLGELAIFLPLLWLFAFFDAYNIHGQTDEQATENPDAYLFGLSAMDSQKLAAMCQGRHSIIGWGLVAMGLYALYTTFIRRMMDLLPDGFWWLRELLYYDVPRLLVTVLMIGLGVWFIRGPKGKKDEADFSAFQPPVETEGDTEGRQEEPHDNA